MLDCIEISDFNAWFSLLGLLSPSEYFVTVDHSILWQKHIAWAKPKGEVLRAYVTQRFASNMIVLSLMLGAEIGVFFNSSHETSEMRTLLGTESYSSLKYWIGIVIALDAGVTVMALVTTFTLWGMVSAISDDNTHALLRSSIGQYVISLPPRFVVMALYLFLLWLTLFFIELLKGPARVIIMCIMCFLFFQVVIPLSAFGRLIIHTGAMAKRRVLDEEFEKELLPSGLHASLLIQATHQQRKNTTAMQQYRKQKEMEEERTQATESTTSSTPTRRMPKPNESAEDDEINFPRASFLNTARSGDLQGVVDRALSGGDGLIAEATAAAEQAEADMESDHEPPTTTISFEEGVKDAEIQPIPAAGLWKKARPRILNAGRQAAMKNITPEWEEEFDVRDLYDIDPPAPIADDEDAEDVCESYDPNTPFALPSPSALNSARALKAFQDLISRENMNMLKNAKAAAASAKKKTGGLTDAARNIATSAKKKVGQVQAKVKVKAKSRNIDIEDPPAAPPGENDYLLGSDSKSKESSKPDKSPRFTPGKQVKNMLGLNKKTNG
jgi:hypothetical protein